MYAVMIIMLSMLVIIQYKFPMTDVMIIVRSWIILHARLIMLLLKLYAPLMALLLSNILEFKNQMIIIKLLLSSKSYHH